MIKYFEMNVVLKEISFMYWVENIFSESWVDDREFLPVFELLSQIKSCDFDFEKL